MRKFTWTVATIALANVAFSQLTLKVLPSEPLPVGSPQTVQILLEDSEAPGDIIEGPTIAAEEDLTGFFIEDTGDLQFFLEGGDVSDGVLAVTQENVRSAEYTEDFENTELWTPPGASAHLFLNDVVGNGPTGPAPFYFLAAYEGEPFMFHLFSFMKDDSLHMRVGETIAAPGPIGPYYIVPEPAIIGCIALLGLLFEVVRKRKR